ncbi:unnamed protein product, partial [Discosporangium mesarthrocarpum]
LVEAELDRLASHMRAMRGRLLDRLQRGDLGTRGKGGEALLTVNGPDKEEELRLPNTLSVSIRGLDASKVLTKLSEKVAASAGAACHSVEHGGKGELSAVLQAMGVEEEAGLGTIRLSVGR